MKRLHNDNDAHKEGVHYKKTTTKRRKQVGKPTDAQIEVFASRNNINLGVTTNRESVIRSLSELFENSEELPEWMHDEAAFADLVRSRNCSPLALE